MQNLARAAFVSFAAVVLSDGGLCSDLQHRRPHDRADPRCLRQNEREARCGRRPHRRDQGRGRQPSQAPTSALWQAAEIIRKGARGTVTVAGHTDAKGSAGYNQKLSERRSASVQKWLVEREDLRRVRFQTKGFGAERPSLPNSKPDGTDDPAGQ